MMNANELMVGDLLRVNHDGLLIKKDSIVQVRGFSVDNKFEEMGHFGCVSCRPIDKKQFSEGIWLDYLDPIPITPDILEKNGFTDGEYKNYCGFVWKYKADGFQKIGFTIQEKQGIIWGEKIKKEYPNAIGDKFSIPGIRYLHELQHALRLCGIDKEIVV